MEDWRNNIKHGDKIILDGKEWTVFDNDGIQVWIMNSNGNIKRMNPDEFRAVRSQMKTLEQQYEAEKKAFMDSLPKNKKGEIDEKNMTAEQKLQHLEYKRGKEFTIDAARKSRQNTENEIKKLREQFDKESDLMKLDKLQDQIDFLTERNKAYDEYIGKYEKEVIRQKSEQSEQEKAEERKVATVPVSPQQAFMDSLPKNEKGGIDYDKINDPKDYYRALQIEFGIIKSQEVLNERITKVQNQLMYTIGVSTVHDRKKEQEKLALLNSVRNLFILDKVAKKHREVILPSLPKNTVTPQKIENNTIKNTPNQNIKETAKDDKWGDRIMLAVGVAFAFIVIYGVTSIVNSNNNVNRENGEIAFKSDSINETGNNKSYNPDTKISDYFPKTTDLDKIKMKFQKTPETAYQSEKNKLINEGWIEKKLANGRMSSCYNVIPRTADIDNYLEIYVGGNTDVAVKIMNYSTNICIRYVYVNSNTSYRVRNIPQGRYYLKIAYGKEWYSKIENGQCTGRFLRSPLYKKGDDILDYNMKYDYVNDGYDVPSYSVKFDIISSNRDNEFDTKNITEDEFNR